MMKKKKFKKLDINTRGEVVLETPEEFIDVWNENFINKFYSKRGLKDSFKGYG